MVISRSFEVRTLAMNCSSLWAKLKGKDTDAYFTLTPIGRTNGFGDGRVGDERAGESDQVFKALEK